jgi:hypothetical protein
MKMIVILLTLVRGIDAPLNEQVVEYARSKLGQKVGDGQCSTLAVEALRHAGGRIRRGDAGAWGDEVKSLLEVTAGDIVQFENVMFSHAYFREDGAMVTSTHSFGHHTAIITRVRKRGTKPILVVMHQNVGGVQIVEEWTMNMAHKKRGTVKFYRPVAKLTDRLEHDNGTDRLVWHPPFVPGPGGPV